MQGNSVVEGLISKCVTCQRSRIKVSEKIMTDLLVDMTQEEPLPTNCGVDMFGPFETKEKRIIFKQYSSLFVCLACRRIRIKMRKSMATDTFILALRQDVEM